MNQEEKLVTTFEYGTRLREDSSREFIENDKNLKLICQKLHYKEVDDRFMSEEFELLQKMTTTKKNQSRLIMNKTYKDLYGVRSKTGPYRVNSGFWSY